MIKYPVLALCLVAACGGESDVTPPTPIARSDAMPSTWIARCEATAASPRPSRPTVDLDEPTLQGDLDKTFLRAMLARRLDDFAACDAAARASDPKLDGTLVVKFYADPRGKIVQVAASGLDAVAPCVTKLFRAESLPPPIGGGGVQSICPIRFHPATAPRVVDVKQLADAATAAVNAKPAELERCLGKPGSRNPVVVTVGQRETTTNLDDAARCVSELIGAAVHASPDATVTCTIAD
jgi:hypothetical protein